MRLLHKTWCEGRGEKGKTVSKSKRDWMNIMMNSTTKSLEMDRYTTHFARHVFSLFHSDGKKKGV